ncbi:hypothetical protein OH768_45250 [Streptomyces sp. NBC_01622]|uniref:hypothetical protein n=1 Tax=Streptomyces sp. NBC_01622 TaxID=2975903 RepID=UPI003869FEED|nr:hypothetical protein OH768_45250 [Streptomyces sp. NBC_01622]
MWFNLIFYTTVILFTTYLFRHPAIRAGGNPRRKKAKLWENQAKLLRVKVSLSLIFLLLIPFIMLDNLQFMKNSMVIRFWVADLAALLGVGFVCVSKRRRELAQSDLEDFSLPSLPPSLQSQLRAAESLKLYAVEPGDGSDDRQLEEAWREEGKLLDPFAALFGILSAPDRYIERAETNIEMAHHTLQAHLSLTINIPDVSHGQTVIIPALWAKKGFLVHNLDLVDREGNPIPRLSQVQTGVALRIVLERLFCKAYLEGFMPSPGDEDDQAMNQLADLVWEVKLEGSEAKAKEVLRSTSVRAGAKLDEEAHRRLERLCELMAGYYLILVETKAFSRCIIQYRKTIPLVWRTEGASQASQPGPAESKSYVRLRMLLGARPQRIGVLVWLPFMARTYRLRVNTSSDEYVISHSLLSETDDRKWDRADKTLRGADNFGAKASVWIQEPAGLPYTQMYIRGLTKASPANRLLAVIQFSEVPPGLLGLATIVSFFLALFITLFTVMSPNHKNLLNSQAAVPPALFLGVLALGVTWLGFSPERESVLRSSMSTRGGLIGVVVVLFGSALLYVNRSWVNKPTIKSLSFFGNLWQWDHLNVWWVATSVASILLFIALAVVFSVRVHRYVRDVKNRSQHEGI